MSSWAGPGLGDTGHRGDVTVSVPAELLLRSNHGTEPQEGGRERQGPRQTAEDAAQLTTRGALLGELRFFLKTRQMTEEFYGTVRMTLEGQF